METIPRRVTTSSRCATTSQYVRLFLNRTVATEARRADGGMTLQIAFRAPYSMVEVARPVLSTGIEVGRSPTGRNEPLSTGRVRGF